VTATDDIEQRLRARLDPFDGSAPARVRGDHDLNPPWDDFQPESRPAAVLAPIIKRREGWTMLFTQRAENTPAHPGQISFPGGRMQAGDASLLETALRETEEEIGLSRSFIEPLGTWEPYQTGTGFLITPIVGLVEPGFALTLCAREVANVFEAPLSFLFGPDNHKLNDMEWEGRQRRFWSMPYGEREIWGATAGMLRALYERLYP
jgi:8-oxo-dGTP pyrophosphatase MutT (NUDIX family)